MPLLPRFHSLWARAVGCCCLVLASAAPLLAQAPMPPAEPSHETGFVSAPVEEPAASGHHSSYSLLETLSISVLGKPKPAEPWTPLTLHNFTDGWCDPWIPPPNGSGGSLRQGWIGIDDQFFNRMFVAAYNYNRGLPGGADAHQANFIFETPITRRYMFGIYGTAVDSVQNGPGPEHTGFGDLTLENRFILIETQDTTLTFNFNLRIPTGEAVLGGNRTIANPYLAWYQDLGKDGWSFRAVSGVFDPWDSRPDGVNASWFSTVGVGQTLTPHDVPLFGDFTYYGVVNFQYDWKEAGLPDHTTVQATAGFRTHLGCNFWLLGGVTVPLTTPKPFQEQYTAVIVYGW